VPVIAPVVAFSVAQLGKPVADQFVTGRLVTSVSKGVALKASPTLLGNVWPAVMMGAPAEMVKVTGVTALVPPAPVAETLIVAFPKRAVPVISPVAVLRVAHGGRLLALHEVGVRSAASVSAGVALKISPVLPVKIWPGVMIGAPTATEIITAASLVPPDPVAVSVIVVVPLSCGVPVMAPVEAFNVAQLGNPVADQVVTGRLVTSESAGIAENAVPTLPVKVWPAGMLGTPAAIVKVTGVLELVPPGPLAETLIVEEPVFVGVPVISPEKVLMEKPSGSPYACQLSTGRFSASVSAGVAEKGTPTFAGKLWPGLTTGMPEEIDQFKSTGALVPPGPVAVR